MEIISTQTNTGKQTKMRTRQARPLHFVLNILRPSSLNVFHYIARHVRLCARQSLKLHFVQNFARCLMATQTTDIKVALA